MHELSIAQEIINIVDQYVPDQKSSVSSVYIKIGKLSNVIVDSLVFCFDAIKSESDYENAKLVVDEIPMRLRCKDCCSESDITNYTAYCPNCRGSNTELISGNELNVTEIEIND